MLSVRTFSLVCSVAYIVTSNMYFNTCAGPDSYFDKFITSTLPMSPEQRAVALEEDEEVLHF